ncbi:MAG: hypothetical protein DDT32_01484 [Syntrophomonadaceae bacterium]|nr:hypothetical protein [Bacillota bacterium]MBT9147719.1 hypothetical protein [Bacillota bacterium]
MAGEWVTIRLGQVAAINPNTIGRGVAAIEANLKELGYGG